MRYLFRRTRVKRAWWAAVPVIAKTKVVPVGAHCCPDIGCVLEEEEALQDLREDRALACLALHVTSGERVPLCMMRESVRESESV